MLKCAIWRIDRAQDVLIAVLNDSSVGLDFLKTKPSKNVGYYYFTFCLVED